jgi:hypothetical protein
LISALIGHQRHCDVALREYLLRKDLEAVGLADTAPAAYSTGIR